MFDSKGAPQDTWLEVEALAFELSVDAFCELTRDVQAPVPIYTESTPLGPRGMHWTAGDILFSKADLGSYAYSRTANGMQDYGHMISFERQIRGAVFGVYEDDPFEHHPGKVSVSDLQAVAAGLFLDLHAEEMYFPKTLLGISPNEYLYVPDISHETLIGKIVFAEWDHVFAALQRGDQYVSAKAIDRLLACLKIAIGTPPQREDVRAQAREALFALICRYIDDELDQSEVTASDLLQKFGVSRAGLYRMFEPYGGVRNYITMRRTVRAMLEISRKINQRGIVTAAAERWGFSSAPNFNRAVKRIFGATPGALFKAPTRSGVQVSRGSMLIDQFMSTVAA
ncbi:MAG: AraC family transcriptional regulator [Pseudomonadota bacterium]